MTDQYLLGNPDLQSMEKYYTNVQGKHFNRRKIFIDLFKEFRWIEHINNEYYSRIVIIRIMNITKTKHTICQQWYQNTKNSIVY